MSTKRDDQDDEGKIAERFRSLANGVDGDCFVIIILVFDDW